MPLSVGTKLGPYEILAPVGEGGMGEVYRARDTRLDRSVAIKVLPEAIAADSGPHAPLRAGSAQHRGPQPSQHSSPSTTSARRTARPYLVMELLEGETLRERLDRGPVAGAQGRRDRARRSPTVWRRRTSAASSIAT